MVGVRSMVVSTAMVYSLSLLETRPCPSRNGRGAKPVEVWRGRLVGEKRQLVVGGCRGGRGPVARGKNGDGTIPGGKNYLP